MRPATDPTTDVKMPAEPNQPMKIAWDDLNTRKVEQRLKEQEALERNRRQAELNPLTTVTQTPARTGLWTNSIFFMACFGLLGGLLAWGGGEALSLRADPRREAQMHLREVTQVMNRKAMGLMSPESADRDIAELKSEYSDNPFFAVSVNSTLSQQQRDLAMADVEKQQQVKDLIAGLLTLGVSGMLIALCLSIAEPVVDRNYTGALVNGMVGAACGLIGGGVVSLFVEKIHTALLTGAPLSDEVSSTRILADAVKWGVLGLFLTLGPGVVMRNGKKLAIGLLGGLIGGLIGGALYDPIYNATQGNDTLGRLVALLAIGLFAGLGTGLIENAAKNGWLKVTAGLIAGKQFILYRNPTFIGSGPECPIYLFKDPKVGKRHAAIHMVPGGFELENLPLGTDTVINGKPVSRVRLRSGDEIQVGMTRFMFQEKTRTA
jgi:hypothetical protein